MQQRRACGHRLAALLPLMLRDRVPVVRANVASAAAAAAAAAPAAPERALLAALRFDSDAVVRQSATVV